MFSVFNGVIEVPATALVIVPTLMVVLMALCAYLGSIGGISKRDYDRAVNRIAELANENSDLKARSGLPAPSIEIGGTSGEETEVRVAPLIMPARDERGRFLPKSTEPN